MEVLKDGRGLRKIVVCTHVETAVCVVARVMQQAQSAKSLEPSSTLVNKKNVLLFIVPPPPDLSSPF